MQIRCNFKTYFMFRLNDINIFTQNATNSDEGNASSDS